MSKEEVEDAEADTIDTSSEYDARKPWEYSDVVLPKAEKEEILP